MSELTENLIMGRKPLGHRNYGSIPHLPGSRLGPGDHSIHEGQAKIATEKARDKHDTIIVTEKLDGSNVGVALIESTLIPLGRAGYTATSSPFLQHRFFAHWVWDHYHDFMSVLVEGERIVGEWLMQAHGTKYDVQGNPFVVFDIICGHERMPFDDMLLRVSHLFKTPHVVSHGPPLSIEDGMDALGEHGFHGAIDGPEGLVWRVERDKLVDRHSGKREHVFDFMAKYVKPDKVDGRYLPNISDKSPVWNWLPDWAPEGFEKYGTDKVQRDIEESR